MAWTVEFDKRALKQFDRLQRAEQERVEDYLHNRVAKLASPRDLGAALKGSRYGELWRYRVGDLRLICQILDGRLIVLVLELGHRSSIYRTPPR